MSALLDAETAINFDRLMEHFARLAAQENWTFDAERASLTNLHGVSIFAYTSVNGLNLSSANTDKHFYLETFTTTYDAGLAAFLFLLNHH